MPAGELKHGPIALIDETMPVVVIAPHDGVFDKTVSNMQEVAARGGRLILVSDANGAAAAGGQSVVTLTMPKFRRWSGRLSMRCRSSFSPITRPSHWAPTSTSRAIWPNR